ncbi:AAA family ATPase [Kitasatospora sp. NPDC087315]|uniref:AAA family ATPase n=1 Tax=Kitasatospora sp. NPDC087315 TaxID=3364069 RepID=UPI00380A6EA0
MTSYFPDLVESLWRWRPAASRHCRSLHPALPSLAATARPAVGGRTPTASHARSRRPGRGRSSGRSTRRSRDPRWPVPADGVREAGRRGIVPRGDRRTEYTIGDVDSDGLWVAHDGRSFALREMSDGYRTVAALVVDILKQLHDTYGAIHVERDSGHPVVTVPGVVIIDEIDAHLHVSWQKRIGGWLKQHFPLVQFLVTTHSPYICQAADPAGLIRLPGPDVDEAPQVVGTDLYDRVVFGSGDDAVLSELFGLDTPYSQRADEARALLVALEMKIVSGEAGEDERERYRLLKRTLTSSPSARVDEVAARLYSLTGHVV